MTVLRSRITRLAARSASMARSRPSRALAWLALAAVLTVLVLTGVRLLQRQADNRVIAELAASVDRAVTVDDRTPVLFARSQFLTLRERFDEAGPLIARLGQRAPEVAADALYNKANTHLRRGLEFIHETRIDDAVAQVNLAKRDYQQALRVRPDDWEVKYNFDIAMRLVRDFPAASIEGEDEGEPPERLWTDLPGRPRGMP